MSISIKGKRDPGLEAVEVALRPYIADHADATVEIYRQNHESIRVRIVDQSFQGVSKADRHDLVWRLLESLPYDVLSDISVLLLLTPGETKDSLMNLEFEQPSRSRL
jgi:stress-induced morphogen